MRTAVRVGIVGGASAVLAGWVWAAAAGRAPVTVVALPVVGAVWLLVLLHHGYLIGREWAHRRRRRNSRERRTAWAPAAGVRPPVDYPNVVRRPPGDAPVDHQGRYRATGVRLAVLPLLAVLLLTAHTVLPARDDGLGIGFVLAECLLLGALVWTVWTEQQPSLPWVTSRVRAELFRREMFLILAGVGPYLGRTDQEVELVRDARIGLLADAGPAALDRFAHLTDQDPDGGERDWRDEVWRRADDPAVLVRGDLADLGDRMRTYLDHRIRRQRLFMELAAEKCERSESVLGRTVKGVVLAAVGVAVSYAVLLAAVPDGQRPATPMALIAVLAAGLPPLCNSALAVQNLLAGQRLAVSYRETRLELLGHENALRRLLRRPEDPELLRSFRALAVRTEATLTEELRRWRITVAKPEFDAGL
ncbi:hypothetical protein ACFUJ0_19140 [Streptomyces sp. NPDC057242]|uniref:hypothetical protein n=1 Tax=unclassified Streptomyces TaxID=2593676 RepID=UPI00363DF6F4